MRSMVLMLILVIGGAMPCFASPYHQLIDSAANRNGIDPFVLRTIAQTETEMRPWTFNVDGEGFYFESRDKAISALWSISKSPWLAKVLPRKGEGKAIRRFFTSQHAAQAFLNSFQRARASQGLSLYLQRTDASKVVGYGESRVRKLWMVNTDIGIAQINYRFHGKDIATVQQWFDPAFNLNYAASFLAKLKAETGSDLAAAGHYHSRTKEHRDKYMKKFMEDYKKELANEGLSYPRR